MFATLCVCAALTLLSSFIHLVLLNEGPVFAPVSVCTVTPPTTTVTITTTIMISRLSIKLRVDGERPLHPQLYGTVGWSSIYTVFLFPRVASEESIQAVIGVDDSK